MYSVDLVSDLHIDQWNPKLPNLYPCGKIKNFPMEWKGIDKSPYLIVAGDVSDDLDLTLSYLDDVSKHYKKILFVDGNHEHSHLFPHLWKEGVIQEKLNKIGNSKLVYLPAKPHIIDGVAYVGMCGWWDYFQEKKYLQEDLDYFKSWRSNFGIQDSKMFINNVSNKACEQVEEMKNWIQKFHRSSNVHTIVLVTHTVPFIKFSNHYRTQVNSLYSELLYLTPKLKFWFFGHTHQQWDKQTQVDEMVKNNELIKSIRFIANPRGRPDDYDREKYQVKSIYLSKL